MVVTPAPLGVSTHPAGIVPGSPAATGAVPTAPSPSGLPRRRVAPLPLGIANHPIIQHDFATPPTWLHPSPAPSAVNVSNPMTSFLNVPLGPAGPPLAGIGVF